MRFLMHWYTPIGSWWSSSDTWTTALWSKNKSSPWSKKHSFAMWETMSAGRLSSIIMWSRQSVRMCSVTPPIFSMTSMFTLATSILWKITSIWFSRTVQASAKALRLPRKSTTQSSKKQLLTECGQELSRMRSWARMPILNNNMIEWNRTWQTWEKNMIHLKQVKCGSVYPLPAGPTT